MLHGVGLYFTDVSGQTVYQILQGEAIHEDRVILEDGNYWRLRNVRKKLQTHAA